MNYSREKAVIITMLIIVVTVLIICAVFFDRVLKILMPLFFAIIIVYLAYPLMERLENKGIRRGTSLLLIYMFFAVVIGVVGVFVLPRVIGNINSLLQSIPEIISEFISREKSIVNNLINGGWPPELKDSLKAEMGKKANFLQKILLGFLRGLLDFMLYAPSLIIDFLLGMIIAYYFIRDSESMKRFFIGILPQKLRIDIRYCGREIHKILIHFVQGQLITASIIAVLEIIGLMILKVKYPFLLGTLGGIFNVIPFFGPFISAIPAVAIAFVDGPLKGLWVILLFVIIQQIDNIWISPKVIEGKLGLHPITTIIAVTAGGEMFGLLGMILILPVIAISKVLWNRLLWGRI